MVSREIIPEKWRFNCSGRLMLVGRTKQGKAAIKRGGGRKSNGFLGSQITQLLQGRPGVYVRGFMTGTPLLKVEAMR